MWRAEIDGAVLEVTRRVQHRTKTKRVGCLLKIRSSWSTTLATPTVMIEGETFILGTERSVTEAKLAAEVFVRTGEGRVVVNETR